MSQAELAEALKTSQPSINRLEDPSRGRPTITTLKKLAAVFDVGLEVRFVPFSKLIKFVSGTPYVESGLSTPSFYVSPFSEDTMEISSAEQTIKSGIELSNELGSPKKSPRSSGLGSSFDDFEQVGAGGGF